MKTQPYDLIGDIHGHYDKLIALLDPARPEVREYRLPELATRSPKTLMIWNQRATATRASLAMAVEVLPEMLAME